MANETIGTMRDRVAIISGGSRGLGRNTSVNLARRGVNVSSGDHEGRKSPPFSEVRASTRRVKSSIVQSLAVPPPRVLTKTSRLPSGENAAWVPKRAGHGNVPRHGCLGGESCEQHTCDQKGAHWGGF
jgi:hypothetical protein